MSQCLSINQIVIAKSTGVLSKSNDVKKNRVRHYPSYPEWEIETYFNFVGLLFLEHKNFLMKGGELLCPQQIVHIAEEKVLRQTTVAIRLPAE